MKLTTTTWRSGRWPSMVKGVEPWVRRICLGNEDGAGIVGGEPHHQWRDQPGGRLVGGYRQAREEGLQEEAPWGDYQEELHGGSLGYGWRVGVGHPQEEPGRRGGDLQWDGVECRVWGRVEAVPSVGQWVKGECLWSCQRLSGWPSVVGHQEEGRFPRNVCVRTRLLCAAFVCRWRKSGVSRRWCEREETALWRKLEWLFMRRVRQKPLRRQKRGEEWWQLRRGQESRRRLVTARQEQQPSVTFVGFRGGSYAGM